MGKVITPEAVLSYPQLFEPDENGKYGAALVFPEGTDLKEMKAAAFQVVVDKFGEPKAKEMLQKKQLKFIGGAHHAFRDDVEGKYAEGSIYINARGKRAPGIVSRIPDPKTGRPMLITDESEIYPGVVVRASVVPYWYDVEGNKGIAWGLNNLQKIRDGERLDGRVAAEDEFAADEDAAASLEDLVDETAQEDEKPKKGKARKVEAELEDLLA